MLDNQLNTIWMNYWIEFIKNHIHNTPVSMNTNQNNPNRRKAATRTRSTLIKKYHFEDYWSIAQTYPKVTKICFPRLFRGSRWSWLQSQSRDHNRVSGMQEADTWSTDTGSSLYSIQLILLNRQTSHRNYGPAYWLSGKFRRLSCFHVGKSVNRSRVNRRRFSGEVISSRKTGRSWIRSHRLCIQAHGSRWGSSRFSGRTRDNRKLAGSQAGSS